MLKLQLLFLRTVLWYSILLLIKLLVFIWVLRTLFGAQTSGRDRIVLTGAFPACEALGLVRTPAGVLVNMTSTTYSGDAAQFGADTNSTSNTRTN